MNTTHGNQNESELADVHYLPERRPDTAPTVIDTARGIRNILRE